MASSENEKLYLSILAGSACAVVAVLGRVWWVGGRKAVKLNLEKQRFVDTDWDNLSEDQLDREVLALVISQPGLFFGYETDPWLKTQGIK